MALAARRVRMATTLRRCGARRGLLVTPAERFQERYSLHFGADDWAGRGCVAEQSWDAERRDPGQGPQEYYLRVLRHHFARPVDKELESGGVLKPITFARAVEDVPGGSEGSLPLLKGEVLEVLDRSHERWWFGRALRLESGVFEAHTVEILNEPYDTMETSLRAMYLTPRVLEEAAYSQAKGKPLPVHADMRVTELEQYLEETLNTQEQGKLVVSASFGADGQPIAGSARVGEALFGKSITAYVRLAQGLEQDLSFQYKMEALDVNGGQRLFEYPVPVSSGGFNPLRWFFSSSK